jgi:hypothetical protein
MKSMSLSVRKPGRIMQRLLALLLALWLGGLGCLSGCALMSSTALAAAPKPAEQLECDAVPTVTVAAEGEHACCHLLKKEDAPKKDVSQAELFGRGPRTHQTMDCCPLARLSSDPARKPRVAAEQGAALPGTSAIFTARTQISFVPRAVRVWRPPRAETYLLCCVFLI